jgi:N-formylglutamate deformylase
MGRRLRDQLCPDCGQRTVRRFLWGMPHPGDDLTNVMVGGCVLPAGPVPEFGCLECDWMGWNGPQGLHPVTPAWIRPGDPTSYLILHVPHSSGQIPDDVRADIVLDDDTLDVELHAMTDRHSAELAQMIAERMDVLPWMAVNPWSRLVIDPERFLDEREEMNRVGMGAVYTRTSDGQTLRRPDTAREQDLIDNYFLPYANALSSLTKRLLAQHGQVLIVDVHSYPKEPLPYELHKHEQRPEICLGVDGKHSSNELVQRVMQSLDGHFTVTINQPFRGCYIPQPHYGVSREIQGLMIELRRDVGDESGRLENLASLLASALRSH